MKPFDKMIDNAFFPPQKGKNKRIRNKRNKRLRQQMRALMSLSYAREDNILFQIGGEEKRLKKRMAMLNTIYKFTYETAQLEKELNEIKEANKMWAPRPLPFVSP